MLYHCRRQGYSTIFTWMMSGKLDFGKTSAPKGDIQWMRHAIFGMVCALVIGIFAWSAESGFLELARPRAEDTYYNLLVQGFRAGQLNVKREAPPGLTQHTNYNVYFKARPH